MPEKELDEPGQDAYGTDRPGTSAKKGISRQKRREPPKKGLKPRKPHQIRNFFTKILMQKGISKF